MIRALPFLTLAVLIGPLCAGVWGLFAPAVQGWEAALSHPSLPMAAWISLKSGLLSTLFALSLAFIVLSLSRPWLMSYRLMIGPFVALPHVSAALGLAFLLAPSGFLFRLASPEITGLTRPLDLLIVQDPNAWTLTFGLVAKELPFLLLMALASLAQVQADKRNQLSASLGHGRFWGWCVCIAPDLYMRIRLPVLAVLVYSTSNVDVAMILGPNTPPSLSVLVLQAMVDPDLALRNLGAALALIQFGLVLFSLGLWRLGELAAWLLMRLALRSLPKPPSLGWLLQTLGYLCAVLTALTLILGIVTHLIWSFAARWRFPEALPKSFTLRTWERHEDNLLHLSTDTVALAFCVALVALVLVLGTLEATRKARRGPPMWLIYLPLLIPQITFLPGLQSLLITLNLGQGLIPVFLCHLVFVLPYVYLASIGPYRALNPQYEQLALSLGHTPLHCFLKLRLPLLLRPCLTALAIGMAVSIGQYLPTLLASGGRFTTLTVEALALSSGGDRRVIGLYALALSMAAWIPIMFASLVPLWLYRNRKEMRP